MQMMMVAWSGNVTGPGAQNAQRWLRASADLFSPGAGMFPGDEDTGAMGSWAVWNALGLYPLSPASGMYVLGSPYFARVEVAMPSGPPLVIAADGQGPGAVYVHGVTWRGAPLPDVTVAHADLVAGGELRFSMASDRAGHPPGA